MLKLRLSCFIEIPRASLAIQGLKTNKSSSLSNYKLVIMSNSSKRIGSSVPSTPTKVD